MSKSEESNPISARTLRYEIARMDEKNEELKNQIKKLQEQNTLIERKLDNFILDQITINIAIQEKIIK